MIPKKSKILALLSCLVIAASPLFAQTPPPPATSSVPGVPAGPSPERNASAASGAIVGTVFDASTGQPVRQAKVQVTGQADKNAVTDTEGKFRIDIAAGTYKVTYSAASYGDAIVDAVVVESGAVVEASTVMANKNSVTTVDVVEKVGAIAATAEAVLSERKLAATVSDAISSEEMRSGVSSDAAGALEKVTGVSIVDNGFVFVRGLGERYSSTMLNGAMIPTTEPERRVVPLDLFPASLMENIKVLKTYSPDLPGEFSGGLVQLSTIDFPATRMLRAGFSVGFNTRTTFDRFGSYSGGGTDTWGFDDGTRALPRVIPTDRRLFQGEFTEAEFQQFGRAFGNTWEPDYRDSMRPSQNYSLVGGGTFGRFGIVGAITASNKPQRYDETQNYYRNSGNIQDAQLFQFTNYPTFNSNVESARLGAVLNIATKINNTNKIVLRNALTRDTDKEARVLEGLAGTLGDVVRSERLRWIERGLLSTSLEGEHGITKLRNALLRWQMTYSKARRDEPDLREVVRGKIGDDRYVFLTTQNSGLRFYNDLNDSIYEPQVDISHPFFKGAFSGIFKYGFRGTFRRRDFQARRFRFNPVRSLNLDLFAPSETLFSSGNIRPDGFQVREETRGTDKYDAGIDLYAGFAMVDLAIGPRWRLVGGLRIEDADIRVTTIDPLVTGARPSVAVLSNRDPLPGVNAIYQLTARQNLRFGYSRTVSRPDFRELSPFEFTNVVGGYAVAGNPNLRRASIDNFDARWEWFVGGNQIIAASFFYKNFADPIEVTIQATADLRQSFMNAAGAKNQGFELEFRKNLAFLNRRLAQFTLQSNFTFVDSDVDLTNEQNSILTSRTRPLVGQSRYIYNANLEWARPQWRSSTRFYSNFVSRRITDVGTFGLPDIYQERNLFLDFVYQYDVLENGRWSIRFDAENLGDNEYRWTQAALPQRQYKTGRTFTIGTSFSFF